MLRGRKARLATLAASNVLLPVALLVFASGFFPYKPVLPGLATFREAGGDGSFGGAGRPPAAFERVVFMVVDALRSDFVYGNGSGFDFTQSLIRSGAAIPFTAHATPPTVTMPRVKALTTGSVPSFLDFILNFAESDTSSSLSTQDTWLAQIRARGGKLVFYGDDTWLKLFPDDFFARADGTSSFFVSDFTEVDLNVTRHVPHELERDDWTAMIMHYLGLDHIGHKTGPQGPNMLPKQREMDDIVKAIYQAIDHDAHHANTLLVLAGDHGMNAGGNHGGSGPGETEPALVFASPKLKNFRSTTAPSYESPTTPKHGTEFHFYDKVEQSDLVPTLAGLMDLPVSRNSLGVFLAPLLDMWSPAQQTQILWQNALQMWSIIEAAYGADSLSAKVKGYRHRTGRLSAERLETFCDTESEGERELACRFALVQTAPGGDDLAATQDHQEQQRIISKFLYAAQGTMSGTASLYNVRNMIIGIVLAAVTLAIALWSVPSLWPPSMAGVFTFLVSGLYGVMMFASSYVEEEQRLWYWITPIWILLLTVENVARATNKQHFTSKSVLGLGLLGLHRLCISWNQTGQKFAGEPDIAHTFFAEQHLLMWLLVLATYVAAGYGLTKQSLAGLMPQEFASLVATFAVLPAVVFKLNFTQADAPELVRGLGQGIRDLTSRLDLVLQAKIVFGLLAFLVTTVVTTLVTVKRNATSSNKDLMIPTPVRFGPILALFLMTQSRTANVPLFLAFAVMREGFWRLHPGPDRAGKVATTALLLAHMSYFCMGGSNSISSIDLSNAYNGVSDYDVIAVGVLLLVGNWAGPIWWVYCSATMLLHGAGDLDGGQGRMADGARATWIAEERAKLREDLTGVGKKQVQDDAAPPGPWLLYLSFQTSFIASSLLAVMAACTALRTHLFIWTVFSPKYLYAAAWSVGWHLGINVGFGSFVRWLADIV